MTEPKAADIIQSEHAHHDDEHRTPGTMTLVLILLACFAIYYFANWKALADVWHVR
jgi:cytochrome c oxidase subunit I